MEKPLTRRLLHLLQLLLVVIFIVFEELIWEGVAKPVYRWVHSLKALERVERWLQGVNRYVILAVFAVMLGSVEAFGLYAGYMFISGHLLTGMALYLAKIPVAAFTFWMFRVSKEKLMRFGWFAWSYGKVMAAIEWLKALEVYRQTMHRLKVAKEALKRWGREMKARYFSGESAFIARLKRLYRRIKLMLKR